MRTRHPNAFHAPSCVITDQALSFRVMDHTRERIRHESRSDRGRRPRGAVRRLATEALGHRRPGVLTSGGRTHPLRGPRPPRPQLGRTRVRGIRQCDRRTHPSDRHAVHPHPRHTQRAEHEQAAAPQGPASQLRLPRPHARPVARGTRAHRCAGERRRPALRTRRSSPARRIRGGPPAAHLRLRGRPHVRGLHGPTAGGRGRAVPPHGEPLLGRSGTDLRGSRHRLLQPRLEHRAGPGPQHPRRSLHPHRGRRRSPAGPAHPRRRGPGGHPAHRPRGRPLPARRHRPRGRRENRRPRDPPHP